MKDALDLTQQSAGWTSVDWAGVVKGYARYWELPFVAGFGGVALLSDGRLPERIRRLREHQGKEAIARLERTLDVLRKAKLRPETPAHLTQAAMNTIVRATAEKRLPGIGARELQTLWEVVILEKAGYRCTYCGRTALGVYEERGRRSALRMVVDHQQSVRQGGQSYLFSNSVSACWSCNHLKGELPRFAFEEELASLARAVMARSRQDKERQSTTYSGG